MNFKHWICLLCTALLLAGCDVKNPEYLNHESVRLYTTVSSDGKLVATLENIGTQNPRLRINWLHTNEPWQELPAPMFTNSIRFGLKGYGLLMTHDLPDDLSIGQLTRWDVSNLRKESQTIHQAPYLAFPVEVKPDEFLARTCKPYSHDPDSCRNKRGSTSWIWVKPGQAPVHLTPSNRSFKFDQPNVTDQGFFWVFRKLPDPERDPKPKHPELLAFPLPRGQAPVFDVTRLGPNETVECDRAVQRCLRTYVAGTHGAGSKHVGDFIYAVEVLYGTQACKVEGVSGFFDLRSITPDGQTAVVPVAPTADQTRQVVVLRFKPGQCEPTSVEPLNN